LLVGQEGSDFHARFFLDCLKPGLCLFTKCLKLVAGFLQDFVYLLSLLLIQPQIVVEFTDVALGALSSVASGDILPCPCDAALINVGNEYSGKYTLTSTRHVFGEQGYRTHFVISGRQDRTLLGLTSLGSSNGHASAGGQPINGVVVALVTDNNDPNNDARVKLKFPWLDDNYESDWARITQLGAGPNSGAVFIPEVNDEVLVAFEFGDIRRPYVVGSLYNGQDTPNLGSGLFDNGKVKRRGIISRKGHQFIFFDDDSKTGIAFISSDGNLKISLNETNSEIHISSQGKIHVESQQDMTFESQANLKLSAQQGITLEAQTNLGLKGGSGATLDGGPQLEMKSSGQTKVTGTMVDVNNGSLQVM